MPSNLQVTAEASGYKNLKFRQYLLVDFGDLVFWWQKNSFRSELKIVIYSATFDFIFS